MCTRLISDRVAPHMRTTGAIDLGPDRSLELPDGGRKARNLRAFLRFDEFLSDPLSPVSCGPLVTDC